MKARTIPSDTCNVVPNIGLTSLRPVVAPLSSTGATFKSFHGAMMSGRSHSNKMPNFPYHSTTALVHAQKLLNLTAITQILTLVVSLLHQANRTANSQRNAANSFPLHYPSTELTSPSLCMDCWDLYSYGLSMDRPYLS